MTRRHVALHRAIECARKMPALRHATAAPFHIAQSEVAKWLCDQPEIRQYVFDAAKSAGVIVYDREAGTWRGADR